MRLKELGELRQCATGNDGMDVECCACVCVHGASDSQRGARAPSAHDSHGARTVLECKVTQGTSGELVSLGTALIVQQRDQYLDATRSLTQGRTSLHYIERASE